MLARLVKRACMYCCLQHEHAPHTYGLGSDSKVRARLGCRVEQLGGLRTGIRPVHLVTTSKMVCDFSGMLVQPHKVLPQGLCRGSFAFDQGLLRVSPSFL